MTPNEPRSGGPSGVNSPRCGSQRRPTRKARPAITATPRKSRFQSSPSRSKPPIGGPIVTPRFDATRTDAYACSCFSSRDEIGDERLVGALGERAERARDDDEREAEQLTAAGGQVGEDEDRLEAEADEDQRLPPEVVGQVAAEVPGRGRRERATGEGDPDRGRARIEPLERPDPDVRPQGGHGDRAAELHGEHRPQRTGDVVAPDEAEKAAEEAHHGILPDVGEPMVPPRAPSFS